MRGKLQSAANLFRYSAVRRAVGWVINLLIYVRYPRALRHYLAEVGRPPNVALPSTYNEKMFWRRVFDRNPAFVFFSDKLAAKSSFRYPPSVEPPETLWAGEDPVLLPDELRRDDVVVKMTAGAGRNWFFAERGYDREAFRATFEHWLRRKPSRSLGEWAYGPVTPALFAERLVKPRDEKLEELKVHLFAGEVFYTVVYVGEKRPGTQSAIFDASGRRLAVTTSLVERNPASALPASYELPAGYRQAMEAARIVAAGFDYLRVDFMCAGGRVFAGEVTVYPTAGLMTNSDPTVMADMTRRWDLRRSWFVDTRQRGWRALYRRLLRAELDAHETPRVPELAGPIKAGVQPAELVRTDRGRSAAATP